MNMIVGPAPMIAVCMASAMWFGVLPGSETEMLITSVHHAEVGSASESSYLVTEPSEQAAHGAWVRAIAAEQEDIKESFHPIAWVPGIGFVEKT